MPCLFHKWDGCKCTKCGQTRDEGHTYSGCTCTQCGKNRNEHHHFIPTPGQCQQHCEVCGQTKPGAHSWQPADDQCAWRCTVCGANAPAPFETHQWDDSDACTRCGAQRLEDAFLAENERYFLARLCAAAYDTPSFTFEKTVENPYALLQYYTQLFEATPFHMAAQGIGPFNTYYNDLIFNKTVLKAAQDEYAQKYGSGNDIYLNLAARFLVQKMKIRNA